LSIFTRERKTMAQKKQIVLISDLTGDEIRSGKGQSIEFAYRGVDYRIDLSDKEAAGFDRAIAMYLERFGLSTAGPLPTPLARTRRHLRHWAMTTGSLVQVNTGRGLCPRTRLCRRRHRRGRALW
jgi:hypothetical protein